LVLAGGELLGHSVLLDDVKLFGSLGAEVIHSMLVISLRRSLPVISVAVRAWAASMKHAQSAAG